VLAASVLAVDADSGGFTDAVMLAGAMLCALREVVVGALVTRGWQASA